MCRDTACSHPNAFEGFTLVAGQTQTWVILAKINRSPGFKKTEGNPARETFQRIMAAPPPKARLPDHTERTRDV